MTDLLLLFLMFLMLIVTIMNYFTCRTVDIHSKLMGRLNEDVIRLKLSDDQYTEYYWRKLKIEEELKKELEE